MDLYRSCSNDVEENLTFSAFVLLIVFSIILFFLMACIVTAIALGTYYSLKSDKAEQFEFSSQKIENKTVMVTVKTNGTL